MKPERHDSIPKGVIPALAKDEDRRALQLSGSAAEKYDDGISMRATASRTPAAQGVDAKQHNVN